jgi:hypothetical protein
LESFKFVALLSTSKCRPYRFFLDLLLGLSLLLLRLRFFNREIAKLWEFHLVNNLLGFFKLEFALPEFDVISLLWLFFLELLLLIWLLLIITTHGVPFEILKLFGILLNFLLLLYFLDILNLTYA